MVHDKEVKMKCYFAVPVIILPMVLADNFFSYLG